MNFRKFSTYYVNLFSGRIDRKIFFLHVPKCGGTSLIEAIGNHYGIAEVITKRHFAGLRPSAFYKASSILGEDRRKFKERLLLYHLSSEKIKFVRGHFVYSEKAMQNFGDEWCFMTLLREPVSRFFSYYFMNRYLDSVPSFAKLDMDLETFIESDKGKRLALEYVTTFTDNIGIKNASSSEAVNTAIDNINNFSLVGILERMDLFVKDYQKLFGVKLKPKKLNKSVLKKQNQRQLVTSELEERVREICQPSTEIYQTIREKVESRNL